MKVKNDFGGSYRAIGMEGKAHLGLPSMLSSVYGQPLGVSLGGRPSGTVTRSAFGYLSLHSPQWYPNIQQVDIFQGIEWQPLCLGEMNRHMGKALATGNTHIIWEPVRMQIPRPHPGVPYNKTQGGPCAH